jgi:hypothetical protein
MPPKKKSDDKSKKADKPANTQLINRCDKCNNIILSACPVCDDWNNDVGSYKGYCDANGLRYYDD